MRLASRSLLASSSTMKGSWGMDRRLSGIEDEGFPVIHTEEILNLEIVDPMALNRAAWPVFLGDARQFVGGKLPHFGHAPGESAATEECREVTKRDTALGQHGDHLPAVLSMKMFGRKVLLGNHRDCVLGRVLPAPQKHIGRFSTGRDRKSTRLNSSHSQISYAVFFLKKNKDISSKLLFYTSPTTTSFHSQLLQFV